MIELYGMSSANVVKILIMLEETGLPYRLNVVDVFKGEQFSPDFERLSPTAKVPVIVDPEGADGAPVTVFESGAILIYLAEKTGRFLPGSARGRIAMMEWLMVQMSLLGPMQGQAIHFMLFAPHGQDYGEKRYLAQSAKAHALLDRRLGECRWLAGEECSIADLATFPWIDHAIEFMPWLKRDGTRLAVLHPHLDRWFRELSQRPGVAKALAIKADLRSRSTRGQASSDDLDRLTLRGVHGRIPG